MDFETYKTVLNHIQRVLLTESAQHYQYKEGWSDEFCRDHLRDRVLWLQAYISLSNSTDESDAANLAEMNAGRYFRSGELENFVKPERLLPLPPSFLGDQLFAKKQELFDLGFGNWDGGLVLIPLWLLPFLNPNEKVRSITGDYTTIGEADNDHRGGFIAYGFLTLLHDNSEEMNDGA
jgi:hypothetical protein